MIRIASVAAICVLAFGAIAQADTINIDLAAGAKVTPAPAGWTEWVMPVVLADPEDLGSGNTLSSASQSFAFAPAAGGNLGVAFATLGGNAYTTYAQLGAAASGPLAAVISDHVVGECTGKGVTSGYNLTLTGLPAGPTNITLVIAFSNTAYENYYWMYGVNRLTLTANGVTPAGLPTTTIYENPIGTLNGSPFTFTFNATGNDTIAVWDAMSAANGVMGLDGFTVEAAVPEPATLCLLLGGMGVAALRRRRK